MKKSLIWLATFGFLIPLKLNAAPTSPTPFSASIINNSGKMLYITVGALPDKTHPVQPGNEMKCPIFDMETNVQQPLAWSFDPALYPILNPSPDIEVRFYTAPSNSKKPNLNNQSNLCEPLPPPILPDSGKAVPPNGTAISCTNSDPIVKYGGVKFSSYSPGILSIDSDGNGGLICTLNAYTTTSQPIPYRKLNVGQNYLPLGAGGTNNTAPLSIPNDPLINLSAHMNNFKGSQPQPIAYSTKETLSAGLISIPLYDENGAPIPKTWNNQALFQVKNGSLFIQHNIGTDTNDPVTYQSIQKNFCPNEPTNTPSFCTVYTDKNGQTHPDKFVLWPTLQASVIVGPQPTDTTIISQTFPIVISNAIRTKTVTELVNQRMAQLVLNSAQKKSPSIQDNESGDLTGTWLSHNSTTLLNANLNPDGADAITPDIQDYLAVSFNTSQDRNAAFSIPLAEYFVLSHNTSHSVQYSLDSSYLQVDPATAQNYGLTASSTAPFPPIVNITGVGQLTPISGNGTPSGATQSGYQSAGPFSINSLGQLTLTDTPDPGVYQINIRADDTNTQESAFNTFYIFVSNEGKDTSYTQWQTGSEPSFSVLSFEANKKFATAYLYTSHDFTKPYDQKNWEGSISTLLSDINQANSTYNTSIQAAFVDVNNLSFQNNEGYWPIDEGSDNPNYLSGTLESSIMATAMQTNLTYIDSTTGQTVYLLKSLLDFFKSTASPPSIALTVYPANNLKADFTGFNDQQRKIFADMSALPALASNSDSSKVEGISVDLEGGLNSTGDTQFYKLLADELAYQGKWFSFFYFPTVASPTFMESLGPLGALEVSSYDVGTYREPGNAPATTLSNNATQTVIPGTIILDTQGWSQGNNATQTVIPGTIILDTQGWSQGNIAALYSAYSQDTEKCNSFKTKNGSYVLTSNSWCNNSSNQSYSESHRMWTGFTQGSTFLYADPVQNIALFNGKIHLVLPVSWSATQYTQLYLFNPDVTSGAQGLFMHNSTPAGVNACHTAQQSAQAAKKFDPTTDSNLNTCLFGNASTGPNGLAVQALSTSDQLSQAGIPHLIISSLPGTAGSTNSQDWSAVSRQTQIGYMNTNYRLYQDISKYPTATQNQLSDVNFAGLGAYALELFENVPSNVSTNAQLPGSSTNPQNAAMQIPWYVGFKPDVIPGTSLQPGYDSDENESIWHAFGQLMQLNH